MGGIAGIVRREENPVDGETLQRMSDSLAHRGPYGSGIHVEGSAGLASRRLFIMDPSRDATQPLSNEDGTIHTVLDGTIYNYAELREELEAGGHRFRTRSDAEVLLHLYEEQGVEMLGHLRGMFAFAIWDKRRRRLLLARDRFGIKPLCYARLGSGIAFASDLRALIHQPDLVFDPDPLSIFQYFTYCYVPAPRTIYRGIRKLPPASFLTWEGGDVEIQRYWHLSWQPDESLGLDEYLEGLWVLLRKAVEEHLMSEVPVGALLSGGLGSGTLTWHMKEALGRPVPTFCVGVGLEENPDVQYARLVARQLESRHHEELWLSDPVAALSYVARTFDEPFGNPLAVVNYSAARLAAQHVTVALSGDGAKETFAGHPRYGNMLRWMSLVDPIPRPLRKIVFGSLARLLPRTSESRRILRQASLPFWLRYAEVLSGFSRGEVKRIFSADFLALLGEVQPFALLLDRAGSADHPIPSLQKLDMETLLPDDVLVRIDRAGMIHSLEIRTPYLDKRLQEFAAKAPMRYRSKQGEVWYLMKRLIESRLPDNLFSRRRGVMTRRRRVTRSLVAQWLDEGMLDYARDMLSSVTFRQRGFFNHAAVRRVLRTAGQHPRGARRVWMLLVFENWCRKYLDSKLVGPI